MKTEYTIEFRTSISVEATSFTEAKELGYDKIFDYFADNGFDYDTAVVSEDGGETAVFGEGLDTIYGKEK